jgi:hypothetical protein
MARGCGPVVRLFVYLLGQVTIHDLKHSNGFSAEDIEILQHLYGDEIEVVTIKPKGRGRASIVVRFKESRQSCPVAILRRK